MMKTTQNHQYGVYDSDWGVQILNPENYPLGVHEYLADERRYVESVADDYDVIIEAGCFSGTYMLWAAKYGKSYVGLDVIPEFVIHAKSNARFFKLHPDRLEFHVFDLTELNRLYQKSKILRQKPGAALLIIPFNLFGNIPDVDQLIDELKTWEGGFIISNFLTNGLATETRRRYYLNCGLQGLSLRKEKAGVRFESVEGLNSTAYSTDWIEGEFDGMNLATRQLGEVGIGYYKQSNK